MDGIMSAIHLFLSAIKYMLEIKSHESLLHSYTDKCGCIWHAKF